MGTLKRDLLDIAVRLRCEEEGSAPEPVRKAAGVAEAMIRSYLLEVEAAKEKRIADLAKTLADSLDRMKSAIDDRGIEFEKKALSAAYEVAGTLAMIADVEAEGRSLDARDL